MRVTFISDTHTKHESIDTLTFKGTDILVHAGDFTGNGSGTQAIDFLIWYEALSVPHKVLVAGNHDFITTKPEFKKLLQEHAPSVTYLCNSSAVVNGIKFWGSPYSNQFGAWAWMADDDELAEIWDTIPLDTQIVVTHGPSYKYNDLVNNEWSYSPYVGSPSLREQLQILPNLIVHACGHIHEGYGITFGDYTSINASILDEYYGPINQPITFTIKE